MSGQLLSAGGLMQINGNNMVYWYRELGSLFISIA